MQFSYLIFFYATLLIIDGITFQILALERDPSILTPVIFGRILLIMGVMTLKKDLQIFGKHGATALSLIAFISSLNNLVELFNDSFSTQDYVNFSNAIMAVLSIIFLILAVRQFAKDRTNSSEKN